MLEVSPASDDEAELSLELSIGGSYGKCEKQRPENEGESSAAADLCRRREIQAMRRLEARKKRDEKMRRLEEQQSEERARCRKTREDEENSYRRKEPAAKITNSVHNSKNVYWQPYISHNVAQNSGCGFVNSGNNVGRKIVGGNGSVDWSSSAVSDYRSTSGKGGSTSDTGSHSSCMQASERQKSIAPHNDISNQPEARQTTHGPKNMVLIKESHCGADSTPASTRPENPVSSQLMPMPPGLTQMPCVTATGNGVNGKTITGFLYRYTNAAEVRIVCVCHGSSFSPAEFVEHAGGTDISNPLRHITVVPSSLG